MNHARCAAGGSGPGFPLMRVRMPVRRSLWVSLWVLLWVSPLVLLLAPLEPAVAQGAPRDSALHVRFGVFIDAYYAYDRGRPPTFDRGFTTQAVRHNEFNLNLAHLDALIGGARVRGRLAVQAGTSVQANYAAEPTLGSNSGPDLARLLQEAYVGYRVTPRLWVDAGVFFSNMGAEGWISADNITYTRSLVADYSPYYSSGVRAVLQVSPRLTARVDLINGWQNVSETNGDKALGTRLDLALREGVVLSHYSYVGGERDGRLRAFTGVSSMAALTERLTLEAEIDVGRQDRDAPSGSDTWTGGVIAARWAWSPRVALTGRGEWFRDPGQVVVVTGGPAPFRATGGSVGIDVTPGDGVRWRSEWRALRADAALFADRGARGGVSASDLVFITAFTFRM